MFRNSTLTIARSIQPTTITSLTRLFTTSTFKMSENLNRAGLTAEQSKALPTREPTAEEKKVVDSISEVCKAFYLFIPLSSSVDVIFVS